MPFHGSQAAIVSAGPSLAKRLWLKRMLSIKYDIYLRVTYI